MNTVLHFCFLLAIPSVILLHLWAAPYTKVEESFNIQAIHDLLVHDVPRSDIARQLAEKFDHVSFSGAVPRTFLGALSVAALAKPLARLVEPGLHTQILVRGLLGMLNAAALLSFYAAVKQAFGKVAGYWYITLQATQFHIMFYASRTLPNMFAFILSTLALRSYILSSFGPRQRRANRQRLALLLLTWAGVTFRSELAILVATISLTFLIGHKASLARTIIPAGLFAALTGLAATVLIDSFFWQKFFIWPEWSAFYFNTIQGKSSEWGISPWHFYFSSAIPRLMLNPMALSWCLPLSVQDSKARRFSLGLLLPLLLFVALFSLLPHKEWRFVIYVIPGLTGVAAEGAALIWLRRSRSWANRLLALALVGSVAASFVASTIMLLVSSLNYPGADALDKLHQLVPANESISNQVVTVHLGNLACQTGVTRFLQLPSIPSSRHTAGWLYDKSDASESFDREFYSRFDFALVEPAIWAPLGQLEGWETAGVVDGFAGISLTRQTGRAAESHTSSKLPGKASAAFRGVHSRLLDKILPAWDFSAGLLQRHVTGGRWIAVKTEPLIYIMRNTRPSRAS